MVGHGGPLFIMAKKKHLIVIERGSIKALYTPELKAYAEQNGAEVRRATWVEPDAWLLRWVFRLIRKRVSDASRAAAWTRTWKCRWRANLALSGGPVIGPFESREAAIAAEIEWLTEKWLLPREKHDACFITEERGEDRHQ